MTASKISSNLDDLNSFSKTDIETLIDDVLIKEKLSNCKIAAIKR